MTIGGQLRVAHFQRRPLPSVSFSVEGVFETVRQHLPPDVHAERLVAPGQSRGITPRLRNIAWASRHQRQINHITGDIQYVALGLEGARTVLTILDCGYLTNTKALKRRVIEWLWYRLPVRRVAAVTVISEFTRNQLLTAIPVDANKVHVIPVCVDPAFVPMTRPGAPKRPVILQVGTPPNKNVERLADALSGLDCILHVVGHLSQSQRDALSRNRVEYKNSVGLSTGELVQAYADCDVLSFCSTYEGFGMPIVEAQLIGRPVVTSQVASMPEIAGPGACLVDPFDPRSIRAGIEKVLTDRAYRDRLVASGAENVTRFSPARVTAEYVALYRDVARKWEERQG